MPKPKYRTRGKTTSLSITALQFDDAKRYGTPKKTGGGYQDTFGELVKMTSAASNGGFTMMAYADNLTKLKRWAARADSGGYQGWCRDVLTANGIPYP
jgi:hypothetical protein